MSSRDSIPRISAFGKLIIVVMLCFAFLWAYPKYLDPVVSRNNAIKLMNRGEYEQAAEIFARFSGYRDCDELKEKCAEYQVEKDYQTALQLKDSGEYMKAKEAFLLLGDYKYSKAWAKECDKLYYPIRTGEYSDRVQITVNKSLSSELIYSTERSEQETVTARLTGYYVDGDLEEKNVEVEFTNSRYAGTAGGWRYENLRYVGDFKNGTMTGEGKLTFADTGRLIYKGEFVNGAYSGNGILYQEALVQENGKLQINSTKSVMLIYGTWKNGNIEGTYTRYYSDGSVNDVGKCIRGIGNSDKYGITYYDESKEGMKLPEDYFVTDRKPVEPQYVADVPYVGMSEDNIHRTRLGRCTDYFQNRSTKYHDKDGRARMQTVYRFYKDKKWIYAAICLDGRVIEVSDFRKDAKPISSGSSWKPQSERDRYDIDRYSNAEDFYDDNIADFFSYEDAETYYNDHKK